MKFMYAKLVFITIFLACVGCISISAQTSDCPADKVCISPTAARKALADADKVIALETESAAKDKAIADMRDELNKLRIEFAERSGENTALKQNAVSDRAIIDLLLKNVRPKKIGLLVF